MEELSPKQFEVENLLYIIEQRDKRIEQLKLAIDLLIDENMKLEMELKAQKQLIWNYLG
jgi:regulator of replication initiation timing